MELTQVGKRLRELREKELRLGTLELSERLRDLGVKGASNASVSRYETGSRMPPADYIWAVSEMTGVTTDWILFGIEPRERAAAASIAEARAAGRLEVATDLLRFASEQVRAAKAGKVTEATEDAGGA